MQKETIFQKLQRSIDNLQIYKRLNSTPSSAGVLLLARAR